ncbi:MAG: hypothetical protein JWN04_3177 [Myxococcaceae bacterium]|nr:hypothetical protein [Myxococcaceae bacterium]
MRIALATPTLHPDIGGPAVSVPAIGRNLAGRGVAVTYLTQSGDVHGAGEAGALRHLSSSDLVHSFGIWKSYSHLVCTAARVTRRPLVCSTMGMLEPWALAYHPRRKQTALALYQRRDLERASALVATAPSEADNLQRLGLRAPVALIPHGVDVPLSEMDRFSTAPSQRPRTVLFMGRINPKKGVLDLAHAWTRLRPQDWRVVIAGPDEGQRAEVEAVLDHAGLRDRFSFVGTVLGEEKRRLFSESELFVLPSYSENFGLVIAEALAYGLPVITTTGTPWQELTTTGSGWWIEPGVNPLECALQEALTKSPHELRRMGAKGRVLVETNYSWETSASRYCELYRWILAGGTAPSFVRNL